MQHTIIIGNGISGTTTARSIRKLSNQKITIISSESKYYYSRTALMYIYMGHMRMEDTKPFEDWFWQKNRIDLLHDHVTSIDFNSKTLQLKEGGTLQYDNLVLALGSKPNKFGWPGQELKGVGGLYHLKDLQRIEKYSKNLKRAVIVGGGLIGIEMAEMFHSRNIMVTLLVREDSYWNKVLPKEESKMVTNHIKKHKIDLRLSSNLKCINDNGTGKVHSAHIKETGEEISCGFVGLTAGVSPNINWLKDSPIATNKGILVDQYLKTSIDNVYAIGDCAELKQPKNGRRSIEAIWYTGRIMGETLAHTITGTPTQYNPGLWFNSAKFFDIEYQVYGYVPAKPDQSIKSLYWQHDKLEKSIRINYEKVSGSVVGFNLMGIRYRHEVCEKWILERTHIEEVIRHLGMANFDPEFFKEYEQNIIDIYNQNEGKNIQIATKRGLRSVLSFLKSKKNVK